MRFDPFTLVIALDAAGEHAMGELYLDDGHSFDYQKVDASFIHVLNEREDTNLLFNM